ncbi:methionine adenosyltransferase [Murdochiella massiliensis]|mgnify:CR=1 FL=1|uniref:methionine adenosyltransferase n=1 Tax=Murdochiella massiliensis TaxID=1673723 RepID=UPI000834DDEC|nr:methionine adenosyltransferase [Murdochiella massiliensis]
MDKMLFTSESVTCGHPDKVCDQVADRILDALLAQDPDSHVACEVTCAEEKMHIFGEISSEAEVDYRAIAREVISEIGYTQPGHGFDAQTCEITVDIHRQSPDIARGIARSRDAERLDAGAGDQGMMFGYACNQTKSLMPLPIELAHTLTKRLEAMRRSGKLPFLLPDGKSQVTVEYDGNRPMRIASVLVSTQHRADVSIEEVRAEVCRHVINEVLPAAMLDDDTQYYVNPTGRFVQGGPAADSGLTGRKLIVDTYGGYARHGGGSFSGKDATKVDRSGAYMARYIAKNIVAQGLADQCEVQLSYAIGLAEPMSVRIETFGTENVKQSILARAIRNSVDMRPAAIIQRFGLTNPIFSSVSCYGHFGSNAAKMPWEQTDLAIKL